MIASNHGLMQNESFFALSILAIGLSNRDKHSPVSCTRWQLALKTYFKWFQADLEAFYQAICDANIGKNLNFVINKYGDKWDKLIIENCMNLLRNLAKSDKVLAELKSNEVPQSLEKLRKNAEAKGYLEALESTLTIFNE